MEHAEIIIVDVFNIAGSDLLSLWVILFEFFPNCMPDLHSENHKLN